MDREEELTQNIYGRMVCRNCKIDKIKQKRQEWLASALGVDRKRKVFEDLFEDADTASKNGLAKPEIAAAPVNKSAGHRVADKNMTALGFGTLSKKAKKKAKSRKVSGRNGVQRGTVVLNRYSRRMKKNRSHRLHPPQTYASLGKLTRFLKAMLSERKILR